MLVFNQGHVSPRLPLTKGGLAPACENYFRKRNILHNNKHFLKLTIAFFRIIFKLYKQIESFRKNT